MIAVAARQARSRQDIASTAFLRHFCALAVAGRQRGRIGAGLPQTDREVRMPDMRPNKQIYR
jgi:hypothetical protein